jgi:flagellar protein FliO/FliZ
MAEPTPQASPAYLSGAFDTSEAQPSNFQAPSLVPTLLNITFSLTFVLVLIYVAYWLLRRFRAGQGLRGPGDSEGSIRVLEKMQIDARNSLAVVEMGGEIYFLGLGQDVQLLSRVSSEAAVQKIRDAAPSPGALLNFQEQLERVGVHLRREQWKRNKQDLRSKVGDLETQIERLKPSSKKKEKEA